MENKLEKYIQIMPNILSDYFETFNIEPVPIKINIVEDMWDAYAELRPDHAIKQPEMADSMKNNNGSVVPPLKFNQDFTILLNKQYLLTSIKQNSADWIGTLVHEAVHITDFITFSNLVGANNFDTILDTSRYRMFHLWTEFHAKAVGYFFLRKYTFDNEVNDGQIEYILQIELPYQINSMIMYYNSTNNADKQLYHVVHFLGHVYVWQKLFQEDFTESVLDSIFSENIWMKELYLFLSTHMDLNTAYEDFDIMKNIIKENFQGLE